MSIFSDIKVYLKVPEVRSEVRYMYAAKLTGLLTLVVFSPLILLGLLSIAVVHVFDFLGQIALWVPHKITDWLEEFQRNQINSAHAKIQLEEIQHRVGKSDDN